MELKLRKAYENATTTFENGRQQTRSITEVRYDIMEGENPVGEAYARPGQLVVSVYNLQSAPTGEEAERLLCGMFGVAIATISEKAK